MGINKSGEVKYVGRSCRPEIRFTEHARSGTNRAELRFVVVKQGLTLEESRAWEQFYINDFRRHGVELYNKINSIAPNKWLYFEQQTGIQIIPE